MELFYRDGSGRGLSEAERLAAVRESLGEFFKKRPEPRRVLLIPPDITRLHSGAGFLACAYYDELKGLCPVDVLPALGTHAPMTEADCAAMYPGIPYERFIVHDWRRDVIKIGEVGGDVLAEISGGLWTEPIAVEVNRLVADGRYDLLLSLGQVVPHEVAGMANHAKNIFVGVGGAETINKSHMLGAVWGLERAMGRADTPVRRLFDYALDNFLSGRPLVFVLTVADAASRLRGLYIGDTRRVFEEAAAASREHNVTRLDRRIKRCVVYLEPKEYKSLWLGNKAIYRTRLAMADGGELLILAPGVASFGEDPANDALIRKYGYRGRDAVLRLLAENADLRENMGAAAHLVHGSPEGRFFVTYAVGKGGLGRSDIESVGFKWADYDEMAKTYSPKRLENGWNVLPGGEEVFFIPNPAPGLWEAEAGGGMDD